MTINDIIAIGRQIAAETAEGGNTAARVGGVIEAIGEILKNQDYMSWQPAGNFDIEEYYEKNDQVFDAETNSCYVSLQTDNVGHPVNENDESYEEGWWMKVIDGASILAAVAAANQAAEAANQAAEAARGVVYQAVDDHLDAESLKPVANQVITQAINDLSENLLKEDYIKGDVRTLAVGQTYAVDEAVKSADGKMLRMTKEVKSLNLFNTLAVGELKSYNSATYKALKAVAAYSNTTAYVEGDYALGRPAIVTITVDVSGLVQAGEISIVIGDATPDNIQVTADSTAASIAADIVEAVGSIDGWTITDNEDGTITIKCNAAGVNTLAFSFDDVDGTGVMVSADTVAGATTVSVYDGSSWSAVTLANMVADETLFENVDVSGLESSYTIPNDLRMDIGGTETRQFPELVASKTSIYISSNTKLGSNSSYGSSLYLLKAGVTYTLNQIRNTVVNNQQAAAVISSVAQYVSGTTLKRLLATGNTTAANYRKGIKYTPSVDEYLVLNERSNPVCPWFECTYVAPADRLTSMEVDIEELKREVYNGKINYVGIDPIKHIRGAQARLEGIKSNSNAQCYLYYLKKGHTYNINGINYNSAYTSGGYELRAEEDFIVGGSIPKCYWFLGNTNKTFKCLEDTYLAINGYIGTTSALVDAMYIVREVVPQRKDEIKDTIINSVTPPRISNTNQKTLSPAGFIDAGGNRQTVGVYAAYAGKTYRITQSASTNSVIACRHTSSTLPGATYPLSGIIASGNPTAGNFTDVFYSPTENEYIFLQTNLATIAEVELQNLKSYVESNVDKREVNRSLMTDVIVVGSSQTEAVYQPMSFAWLERLNDILDLNFHNDGWSGYSFNENLTNIMTLTGNAPEYLGPRGDYTYKHRQISARYYLFHNSANGTPYGASAYNQLLNAVRIAKSLGAKVLFGNEAALGDNKIAYTRRAFCKENHIPYVSVLEELKMCYPCSDVGASTNRMPYHGWFANQHLGYRAFAIYERYVEMLERIPIYKSVKLFKLRPMYKNGTPTVAQLAYDDNLGRLRYFTAITCAAHPGRTTAQIDNLDNDNYKVAGGDNTGVKTAENAALKVGSAVSFNHIALVEFILERVKITKGTFEINCSVQPTNVYIAIVRTNGTIRTAWTALSYSYIGNTIKASISRSDYDIQMDDKVRILIECEGAFTLANPIFRDYNGKPKEYREESIEGYHERLYGTELNPQTGFPTSGHGWTLSGNAKVVALPSQIANYTAYNSYNSHLQLDDNAASAAKTISIERGTSQVAIRVVCCVYPKIATTRFNVDGQVPEALQEYVANDAPQIRTYEYDYGTIALTINDCAIKKALVWPGWAELYFEVDVPPTATSIKLQIGRETFTDASYNVNSWPMFIHDVSVQKIR